MIKLKVSDAKLLIIMVLDAILLTFALYAAYLVRFDFDIPAKEFNRFATMLPLALVLKIAGFYFFDLYRGMWRYISTRDLLNIIKGAIISTLLIVFALLFANRLEGFSRSVFVIDLGFTIIFVSGLRLGMRLYFEQRKGDGLFGNFKILVKRLLHRQNSEKTLVIIGAGDCGEKIYREIRDNLRLHYQVVGFLDDDSGKVGKKIHGIPVLGTVDMLQTLVQKIGIDEALIAIPSASAQQLRSIVAKCREVRVPFKTIPGMDELINGRVTVSSIRNVDYRDLLRREVVKLDAESIGSYLKSQRVLVTGAGGSIGSELCRQICRFAPERIILYERAESPLYDLELELKERFADIQIIPLLGDIRYQTQLEKAFETHRPQTVFHAAAYKHVPMLELQPWKAVDNNIVGTLNLVQTAEKFHAERFVFVSTDKAVRPANIMGATKRVNEMLIQAWQHAAQNQLRFVTVRFGNVVGSAGSVIPIFKKQIEKGGPVTVTHPEVTRYFMTIPEASQLILQAGAMGLGGEIFILNMGEPVKIDDMARDLIRFSGYEPDTDIKIAYIGLRPGEKLYEELITEGEGIVPTKHEKIMVLKDSVRYDVQTLHAQVKILAALAEAQQSEAIKLKLKEIVPEYR